MVQTGEKVFNSGSCTYILMNDFTDATLRGKCPSPLRVAHFIMLHSCYRPPPPLFHLSLFLFYFFSIFLPSLFSPSLSSSHYLSDSDWSSFPHQSTAQRDRARQLHPSMFIQLIIHTFSSNIVTVQLKQQSSELANKAKVIWCV